MKIDLQTEMCAPVMVIVEIAGQPSSNRLTTALFPEQLLTAKLTIYSVNGFSTRTPVLTKSLWLRVTTVNS